MTKASPEITYILLIFILLVVPHFFHRIKIPVAITTFMLGIAATATGMLQIDGTISLLATLGISALFLFAGMEVDFSEVKQNGKIMTVQVLAWIVFLIALAFLLGHIFELEIRASLILALALLTPSTGFIIDSLDSHKLKEGAAFFVKSTAISIEIVALILMFIVLQADSSEQLIFSVLSLIGIIAIVPFVFFIFAKTVIPHAPDADFAFFLMVAVLAGYLTKKIGAYYLVGAFIVGVVARRFDNFFPSRDIKETLQALRLFSTFFVPVYFFKAGMNVHIDNFTLNSFGIGLLFFILLVPIRLGIIMATGRLNVVANESNKIIALCLLPTLVFGLVLMEILSKRFSVDPVLLNGLMIYTIAVSMAPKFIIRPTA